MNIRIYKQVLLAAATAALMTTPLATQAKDKAMDTCIDTFVKEQLPEGHSVKVVKRRASSLQWGGTLQQPTRINVSAKGGQSGADYGSATCVMNRKGELIAMEIRGQSARYAESGLPKSTPQG